MTTWDHVTDGNTLGILLGNYCDSDSIADALGWAEQCLQADQHNEDVTDKMYSARASALAEADECWNEHADTDGTVQALRRFWSS